MIVFFSIFMTMYETRARCFINPLASVILLQLWEADYKNWIFINAFFSMSWYTDLTGEMTNGLRNCT